MHALHDSDLLDCYREALELKLDEEFIQMLFQEIKRRQLKLHDLRIGR